MPIAEVVAAARHAHAERLERLERLSERARTRGWIPTLDLSARRGQAVDLASTSSLSTDSLRLSTDNDLTLQATLRFDLPRLLFAREEVSIARERRARLEANRKTIDAVITLYFERRALLLSLANAIDESEIAQLRLQLAEVEARLSVFTNGRFPPRIRSSDGKPTDTSTVSGSDRR
ncbi:MAG: hypothetical protein OXU20_01635 [Myxococcales bacterium]|nr:hypothetical protein [Myxococcales bacterium]